MTKGKMHTKITALGYTKKRGDDITVREQLVHIKRDKENIRTPHAGIDESRSDLNIVLHGDYDSLLTHLSSMKTIPPYDRDKLNAYIGKYRSLSKTYQKELEECDIKDTHRIEKLTKQLKNAERQIEEKTKYRDSLAPNRAAIDYFEIVMSISNAEFLHKANSELQKEYFMIFQNHLQNFFEENMLWGNQVFCVGHLDQSNLHIHSINKNQGGWAALIKYYRDEDFSSKNPFTNMIEDITKDFKDKHSEKLKKFGIELEDNTPYMKQLNYTEISRLKVRKQKKEKAEREIAAFQKVVIPENLKGLSKEELEALLTKAKRVISDRDNWISENVAGITYIDDKKHQIDSYKQQLRDLFYIIEPHELEAFTEYEDKDAYIQKKLKIRADKEHKRATFLLQITQTFNEFLEYIKNNLSRIIHIPDPKQRMGEFNKLEKEFETYLDKNMSNMNENLARDLKLKDYIYPHMTKEDKRAEEKEEILSMIKPR